MPSRITTTSRTYVDSQRNACCSTAALYHVSTVVDSSKEISYRYKSSRAKPADLMSNLTGQGQAYSWTKRSAFIERYKDGTCSVPYPPCTGTWRLHTLGPISCPTSFGNMPVLDQAAYNAACIRSIQNAQVRLSRTTAQLDKAASIFRSAVRILAASFDCVLSRRNYWACYEFLTLASWCIRHPVKCAANTTLGINFALKPLALSLFAVAKEIGTGTAKSRVPLEFMLKSQKTTLENGWEVSYETTWTVRGSILLKPTQTGPFQFGNPAEWAWERIPFSFVVDWMIPVGNYIAAFGTLASIQSVGATITTRQHIRGTYKVPQQAAGYTTAIADAGGFEFISHKRDIAAMPGLPTLLQWKPSRSYISLINAIALLAQLKSKL